MTFKQRVWMAGMIAPALLLVFFGLFACSPLFKVINLYLGFGISLLGAYSSAHCIVIACCIWRDSNR